MGHFWLFVNCRKRNSSKDLLRLVVDVVYNTWLSGRWERGEQIEKSQPKSTIPSNCTLCRIPSGWKVKVWIEPNYNYVRWTQNAEVLHCEHNNIFLNTYIKMLVVGKFIIHFVKVEIILTRCSKILFPSSHRISPKETIDWFSALPPGVSSLMLSELLRSKPFHWSLISWHIAAG